MVVRVMVSGLLPYDSGKTWLGASLVRLLLSYGVRVGVYKPVAGHNAWSQYPTVVESLRRGVLVGEDVVKYISIVSDIDVELVNPIDMLLAPPDPLNYLSTSIYRYLDDLENQFKQIVLARVSSCLNRSTQHFIFRDNIEGVAQPLREELEMLSAKLRAIEGNLGDFIQRLRNSYIEDELMICLERIEIGREVTIVESFNNAIAPFRKMLDGIDILIVVAPGAIAIYRDIEDVVKTVDELVGRYGERGFEAIHLLSRVKPSTTQYIRPRTGIDLRDESIEQLAKYVLSNR
ncbi:MAG: hypothetical protein QXV81_07985 [Ignisphaera sp.]